MAEISSTIICPRTRGANVPADHSAWMEALRQFRVIEADFDEGWRQADAAPYQSPEYQRLMQDHWVRRTIFCEIRDSLMQVPSHTLDVLVEKMEIADPADDKHHELCLADLRRLARGG